MGTGITKTGSSQNNQVTRCFGHQSSLMKASLIEGLKGQTFSQFPTPDPEMIDDLKGDLELIESLMKPAEPRDLNIMLGRLRALPSSRMDSAMSPDQAKMAMLDKIDALSDLPADLVELARWRCMRNCKFSPSPAEIREQVKPEIDEREMASSIIKALLMKAGIARK